MSDAAECKCRPEDDGTPSWPGGIAWPACDEFAGSNPLYPCAACAHDWECHSK